MRDFETKIMKTCASSPTVQLMTNSIEMRKRGVNIEILSGGEPDFDSPAAIKLSGIQAIEENYTHYTSSAGIIELRKQISEKLWIENNIKADSNTEIIVTPSSRTALFMALMSFLEPGDEALLLEPNWVTYKEIVRMTGATCVSVPLPFEENFNVTKEFLESKVTHNTKVLIIGSPCNPTGHVLSKGEVDIITDFIDEHDLLLISDELYEKLVYDEHQHISPASNSKVNNRVITLNGFSKGYAMTGWRLGYSVANPILTKTMMKMQEHMVGCSSSIAQRAAMAAFSCEKDVAAMVAQYKRRRDYFVNELQSISNITCQIPEGAFYIFCKIDYKGMNSYELCDFILEKARVLAVPGDVYGAGGEKCVRFAYATSMDVLEKAADSLKKIFR